MADIAKRFAGPVALGTTAATIYTVPGGATAILRNIHVANEAGATATLTLSIGTDGAGKRLFKDVDVATKGVLDWAGFVVLTAGEVVQAFSGTGSALTLTISGVQS